MKTIETRRSIRHYQTKDIPDSLLHPLLELAARTQTMGNMQLYSVVVTRDRAMKEKLLPLHFHQAMVVEAPVVLTLCADFNRTTQWCRHRRAEAGYRNFLSFLNAASDALLYAQTFCNLAEEAGLGICYLGTTLYTAPQLIDALGLPALVFPVATLTLGYPAEEPPLTDRLPPAAFIHSERYADYSSERIDACYAHKESLPENRRFVAENAKETLAQVYTDVRYRQKDNEAFSRILLDTLRQQGFLGEQKTEQRLC